MPSRKRRQGQSRKSNASSAGGGCSHGMPTDKSLVRLATKFTNIHSTLRTTGHDLDVVIAAIEEQCPTVLSDESVRDGVRASFLSFAASIILAGRQGLASPTLQITIESLVLLECGGPGKGLTKAQHMSCRDAMDGCERSLMKFYASRLPCSCLDEKLRQVKETRSKIGQCSHCKQMKERKHLFLCSLCMIKQYCGEECQKEAWKDHKHVATKPKE